MSTSREALVDVVYLDDCEQYEPASKSEISRTCLSMTAYNLQSTLPLPCQGCQKVNWIRRSRGSIILLMFIRVHNWILLGSWCSLCTDAAR